jgi:diamine N-acetyltransferase
MRTTAGGIDVDEQPGFVIEGARVALGPLRMDLVATYQRWENDLEVANANGRVIPFTLEAERERIAGRSGKPEFCDFTVYERADQAPIGWSSLFHIDHRNRTAQFGIDLGERRGQGLGTEATRLTLDWGFSVLGLHNIMLAVAAWNERAIRVYTKVGFREVGRRRGAGLTMGRRSDGVFMDLLATEFLQANESVLAGRAPHGLRPASR